jgi:hypothetical protein
MRAEYVSEAHTGFEPVSAAETLYEPLRRKLEALRTRTRSDAQMARQLGERLSGRLARVREIRRERGFVV